MRTKRRYITAESATFYSVNTIFMTILVIVTLYPFWNTIVVSFNDATDTIRGGIYLWPRIWSLQNYKAIFVTGTLFHAFFISVARTVLFTLLSLYLTAMLAYALSRREFGLRKVFTTIIVLTMYVNAGIIPVYFLIRSLGLINTFWVYIFSPMLIGAFNFIVIRTYMSTIPESFVESARMDGAGDFLVFMRIMLPLCKPVLATIALFIAVGAWNSWFDTLLYASSDQNLSTLQYELMKFLSASMNQSKNAADVGAAGVAKNVATSIVTPVSIRASITVVASVPILLVYPFLQRYFVVGLNIGGVKE